MRRDQDTAPIVSSQQIVPRLFDASRYMATIPAGEPHIFCQPSPLHIPLLLIYSRIKHYIFFYIYISNT